MVETSISQEASLPAFSSPGQIFSLADCSLLFGVQE